MKADSNSYIGQQKGMTLIEVLIASLILFMAIGLTSSVYQQSFLFQGKVLEQIEQQRFLKEAERQILFQLEQGIMNGSVSLGGREAVWRASVSESKRTYHHFNLETQSPVYGKGNVSLLDISYQFVNSNEQEQHSYQEVIWQP